MTRGRIWEQVGDEVVKAGESTCTKGIGNLLLQTCPKGLLTKPVNKILPTDQTSQNCGLVVQTSQMAVSTSIIQHVEVALFVGIDILVVKDAHGCACDLGGSCLRPVHKFVPRACCEVSMGDGCLSEDLIGDSSGERYKKAKVLIYVQCTCWIQYTHTLLYVNVPAASSGSDRSSCGRTAAKVTLATFGDNHLSRNRIKEKGVDAVLGCCHC